MHDMQYTSDTGIAVTKLIIADTLQTSESLLIAHHALVASGTEPKLLNSSFDQCLLLTPCPIHSHYLCTWWVELPFVHTAAQPVGSH